MAWFKYEGWSKPDGHCSCATSIEPCSHGDRERGRVRVRQRGGREGGREREGGRKREGREGEGETFVPQSGQDQVSVFN